MSTPKPPRSHCPFCGGSIQPLQSLTIPRLGPNQQILVNMVTRAKGKRVLTRDIIDRIWAMDSDGGPQAARKTVAVMVYNINKKMAPFKRKIEAGAGRQDGYRVVYL